MKTRILAAIFLFGVLLVRIPCSLSQGISYDNYAGYVDFGDLNIPENTEDQVEIFLESPILKFMAKITASKEPEFAGFLEKIVLIKANIFGMSAGQNESLKDRIDAISGVLKSKNWQRMVYVRDRTDEFEIYMLLENDKMQGLAVMGMDKSDDSAVFLNIVGEIDPEQLGRLSEKFNIPGLDDIHIH